MRIENFSSGIITRCDGEVKITKLNGYAPVSHDAIVLENLKDATHSYDSANVQVAVRPVGVNGELAAVAEDESHP